MRKNGFIKFGTMAIAAVLALGIGTGCSSKDIRTAKSAVNTITGIVNTLDEHSNKNGNGSNDSQTNDTTADNNGSDSTQAGEAISGQDSNAQYVATQWSMEQYPDYYRVVGKAIIDSDVQPGNIEYTGLDSLGRTQRVNGNITYQMVEKSKGWREKFDSDADKISGWGHNEKVEIDYGNGLIYHGYMYNRSHLIADSLGGAAKRVNLICGTRPQNALQGHGRIGGMAYAETKARNYLNANHNGSLYYCAIPVYVGNELVPRSVYVEMKSDDGSIDESVEVFNTANGYTINYNDGTFSKN